MIFVIEKVQIYYLYFKINEDYLSILLIILLLSDLFLIS